jgi:hypothetical protein
MSSGGLAGLATQRLNEVVYCSRFFELNDEVEQELAAEEDDFLSINISASQQENYEDQRKQFKVTSAIEQTAKSSSHSSSLAPQSQSLEFAPKIQAHTLVPKFKFSKVIKKGGLDFEKENVKFRASGKE